MESCSLPSSTVTTIPTSFTNKSSLLDKTSIHGKVLKFPTFNKNPLARKLNFFDIRAQSSGIPKFSSAAVEAIREDTDVKGDNVAFVAGATGKVGSRTVRELIKLGFRVRAGVRSAERAQTLVQSVKQMKLDDGEEIQPVEKLEIVECDLEKPSQIVQALGNASIVFCCIGASEKEVFDVTGPYRIDYMATKNLVDAATVVKVKHFFMVSSLGTNKVGFPAAILNLFWGVLCWKRRAEIALIESGIPYTIVRPGGMERPTDAYKLTHNVTLSEEDTLFGGQVSNLQIAELMAFMAKNLELSYCKVVEVIAETTAPLTPMDKLLQKIPSQRAPPKVPVVRETLEPASSPKVVTEPPSPSPPIEKEAEQPKAVVSRPLSPYPAYEDWKPPSSPSPAQVTGQKVSVSPVDTTPKPDTADTQTSSSVSAIPETVSSPAEAKIARPLSPYAAYEDLKPPTSPSPTPSGPKEVCLDVSSATEVESPPEAGGNDVPTVTASTDAENNTPPSLSSSRSPFMVYEDLKPPTSPIPTPSGPKEARVDVSSAAEVESPGAGGGNDVATVTASIDSENNTPPSLSSSRSPYMAYDDLKPPTSPSPTAPVGLPSVSSVSTEPKAGNSAPPTLPSDEQQEAAPKQRPLSPYAMYEDLKPPTSPCPTQS